MHLKMGTPEPPPARRCGESWGRQPPRKLLCVAQILPSTVYSYGNCKFIGHRNNLDASVFDEASQPGKHKFNYSRSYHDDNQRAHCLDEIHKPQVGGAYRSAIRQIALYHDDQSLSIALSKGFRPEALVSRLLLNLKTHKDPGNILCRPIHSSHLYGMRGLAAWINLQLKPLKQKSYILPSANAFVKSISSSWDFLPTSSEKKQDLYIKSDLISSNNFFFIETLNNCNTKTVYTFRKLYLTDPVQPGLSYKQLRY